VSTIYDVIQQSIQLHGILHQQEEMPATLNFLLSKNLNGFIEVGSANGASFHCWAAAIPNGIKMSVDLNYGFGMGPESELRWEEVFTGADVEPASELKHEPVRRRNNTWRNYFDDVVIVEGNCMAPQTVEKVKNILNGKLVDWIFIDAWHDYVGMTTDFNNYNQFLSPDGYMGFHDIFQYPSTIKFWNLVKSTFENVIEINYGTGIGIIPNQEIIKAGIRTL
jgi:hypothetical protein